MHIKKRIEKKIIIVRYLWENMSKVLTGESSKGYKKKQVETEWSKIMYNCSQLNMFHHDCQLQFYMYAFMYVDTETIPVEGHFPATKICVVNYKKISTPGTVPKHCLGFSYMHLEHYELYQNFNDT